MPARRRVFRGLTSAGRKVRGLRTRGRRRAFVQRKRIKRKLRTKLRTKLRKKAY